MAQDLLAGAQNQGGPIDLLQQQDQGQTPQGREVRPGFLPKTPGGLVDLGAGLARGMVETAAGPVQFLGDAADTIGRAFGANPEIGQAITNAVNEWRQGNAEAFPNTTTKNVSEFVGNILPYLAVPAAAGETVGERALVAALTGGAGGALSFAPGEDLDTRGQQRWFNTALSAPMAAGGQLIAEGATAAVNKFANSKVLSDFTKEVTDSVKRFDPNLNTIRENVDRIVNKSLGQLETARNSTKVYGDNIVGGLDTASITNNLKSLLVEGEKKLSPNSTVMRLIDNAVDRLEPKGGPPALPPELQALPEPFRTAATQRVVERFGEPKLPKYSDLFNVRNEISEALKDKPSQAVGDSSWDLLKRAKKMLDSELSIYNRQYPELGRLAQQATGIEDKVTPLLSKDFRTIREGTAFDRAEALLKIATSGDKEIAQQASTLIGQEGTRQVQSMILKDAIDQAASKGGKFDPSHFIQYFRGEAKPSLDPFIDKEMRTYIKGVENLLSEHALRTGKNLADSPVLHRGSRYIAYGGLTGSALAAGSGQFQHAFHTAAATAGAVAVYKMIEHALESPVGRNFLSASAAIKPGTPRFSRVFDEMAKRFMQSTAVERTASPGQE